MLRTVHNPSAKCMQYTYVDTYVMCVIVTAVLHNFFEVYN